MSTPVQAERNAYEAERRARVRNERMSTYLAQHGCPPPCACGCGEQVKFDHYGRPRTYRPGHNYETVVAHQRARSAEGIPIEDFRDMVRQIKMQRGWIWSEVADKAGISQGHIRRLMFGKGQVSVSQQWAVDFFTSIGAPARACLLRIQRELHSNP